MIPRMLRSASILAAVLVVNGAAFSQGSNFETFKSKYDKIEAMIPMRDGVKLYTAIYVPKESTTDHPILMERTPYSAGPYGAADFHYPGGSHKFQDAGYIFAYQDVRGKYLSEGDYINIRPQLVTGQTGIDESTDTYDTVDWLVRHVPHNNGKVGLWGISYPGFYAGVGAINGHPALAAVSPQAPVSNWFVGDDFHHNGAYFLDDAFNFLSGFGPKRPAPSPTDPPGPQIDEGNAGDYSFFLKGGALPNFDAKYLKGSIAFWNDMLNHPTYDDWWKARALPEHMRNVHAAVLVVGGWFDAEDMWGALNTFNETKAKNPTTPVSLVMGPWFHGMWADGGGRTFGDLNFDGDTSSYFQDELEFPFFEKYLRGQNVNPPSHYTLFNTGANGWKTFDVWPPKDLEQVNEYLQPDGKLARTLPPQEGRDSYLNDPANPTPYLADTKTQGRTREYMVDDQRWADSRNDVLTYRSPVFNLDTTIAGPIDVDLFVSTTGTDADFVVKVIDVWPSDAKNGARGASMADYEQELRADIFRGKFRDGFSDPKPFEPGKPTRLHFKLNDVLHTLKSGHRLEVQIQSDWFPLVDRNPNVFEDIYKAKDSDFHKATISIFRSKRMPSHINFGIQKS